MLAFSLAFRNLLRQFRRSALSTVSVIAGVSVLIIGDGFIGGFTENMIRSQTDSLTGEVFALPDDYPTRGLQHPVDHLFTVDPALASWLDQNSVAWTRRVVFAPRAVHGADAMRVRAFGFDPVTDIKVFPRSEWQVEGKAPSTVEDGVLVSTGVASMLALKVGERFVLETRTSAGALNALDVPVAGILTTQNPMFDNVGVFVPSPLVQSLVQSGERASHLAIRLPSRDGADAFAARLREQVPPGVAVRTWYDEAEPMLQTQRIRQKFLDIMAWALLAIAATGIANTVLMAAYERVREIGTLRALGMTRQGVVGLFVTEGLLMGVIGSLVGALLGSWLVWKWHVHGLDLAPLLKAKGADNMSSVSFSTMLYAPFSWFSLTRAVVFGLAVAVLASIWPALIASKMPPAEAVRSE